MTLEVVLEGAAGDDLSIVNLERSRRGLPPSEKRWVCQHSCAEETIPGCSEANCEAMLVTDSADVEELRRLVRAGDLGAFDSVARRFHIAMPAEAAARLSQRIGESGRAMQVNESAGRWSWSGSLLAFAIELPRIARDPALRELARSVVDSIRREFDVASSLLLDQRCVHLGTPPWAGVVAFETRAAPPGIARVAWGELARGSVRWRDAMALRDRKEGPGFGPIRSRVALEVGEYMGPSARVEAWVDPAGWQRSRELREEWTGAAASQPAQRCAEFMQAMAERLGLADGMTPLPRGVAIATLAHEPDYLPPARFVRALIDAIPLAGKKVT